MTVPRAISRELLAELTRCCNRVPLNFAVLGGAACFALGGERTTADVDLVVETTGVNDIEAKIDALVATDPDRFNYSIGPHGIPHLKFDGFEVEIFDPWSWPTRPQYREFLSSNGTVSCEIQDIALPIVIPHLLLREKLITSLERKGNIYKVASDKADISFLLQYCKHHEITLDLRGDSDLDVTARAGLEEFLMKNSTEVEVAKKVVLIP